MVAPTFADDVDLLCTLLERLWPHHTARPHRGQPFVSDHKAWIVFCGVMPPRRICRFTAQRRCLQRHPDRPQVLGLDEVPQRTTLPRRYKALSAVGQDFLAFLGQYAQDLAPRLPSEDLEPDTSLCKAHGPVWPQADRQAGRLPDKLRHLDTDGSGSKSGSPGWVYGYGLPGVNNRLGVPQLGQVAPASVAEQLGIDHPAAQRITHCHPATVTTDNSSAHASRMRQWANRGGVLAAAAVVRVRSGLWRFFAVLRWFTQKTLQDGEIIAQFGRLLAGRL